MPTAPAPVRPAGKGKGLGAKSIGGLPLWAVVIGGAIALYAGYRFYKNYQANAATAPATSTAPATAVDPNAGGGASGSPTDPNATGNEDLANAIYGLTSVLGGGGGTFNVGQTGSTAPAAGTSSAAAQAPTASLTPYVNSLNPGTIYADPTTGAPVALQPSGALQPAYIGPSGNYVSPATYTGLGITPDPVSSGPASPAPQQIPAPLSVHDTILAAPVAKAATPAPKPVAPVYGVNTGGSKSQTKARSL